MPLFWHASVLVHHLGFFGIGQIITNDKLKRELDNFIDVVIPNSFGIKLASFLTHEALPCWLYRDNNMVRQGIKFKDKPAVQKQKFEEPFIVFKDFLAEVKNMVEFTYEFMQAVVTFKVALERDQSVWHEIQINSGDTFADLHLIIQEAFEFDNDHLHAFYVDGYEITGHPDEEDEKEDD